jgi:putative intracellular protease/amidase
MSVVNLIRRQVQRTTKAVVVVATTSSQRTTPRANVAGIANRRSFSAQPSTPDEYDAPLIPGIGRGKTSTGLVRRSLSPPLLLIL